MASKTLVEVLAEIARRGILLTGHSTDPLSGATTGYPSRSVFEDLYAANKYDVEETQKQAVGGALMHELKELKLDVEDRDREISRLKAMANGNPDDDFEQLLVFPDWWDKNNPLSPDEGKLLRKSWGKIVQLRKTIGELTEALEASLESHKVTTGDAPLTARYTRSKGQQWTELLNKVKQEETNV